MNPNSYKCKINIKAVLSRNLRFKVALVTGGWYSEFLTHKIKFTRDDYS